MIFSNSHLLLAWSWGRRCPVFLVRGPRNDRGVGNAKAPAYASTEAMTHKERMPAKRDLYMYKCTCSVFCDRDSYWPERIVAGYPKARKAVAFGWLWPFWFSVGLRGTFPPKVGLRFTQTPYCFSIVLPWFCLVSPMLAALKSLQVGAEVVIFCLFVSMWRHFSCLWPLSLEQGRMTHLQESTQGTWP